MEPKPETYLSVKEVAGMLGVSRDTATRWIDRHLPSPDVDVLRPPGPKGNVMRRVSPRGFERLKNKLR